MALVPKRISGVGVKHAEAPSLPGRPDWVRCGQCAITQQDAECSGATVGLFAALAQEQEPGCAGGET
jgi:hypothetical protein